MVLFILNLWHIDTMVIQCQIQELLTEHVMKSKLIENQREMGLEAPRVISIRFVYEN